MEKESTDLVNLIRQELETDPVEDVYQKYFGGKEWSVELNETFLKAYDVTHLNVNEFNNKKIKFFKIWIEEEKIKNSRNLFPNFIDLYIGINFDIDGHIVNGMFGRGSLIVVDRDLTEDEDLENFVEKYEALLPSRTWWSNYESKVWNELQEKRSKIKEFEDYIYRIEFNIRCLDQNDESFIVQCKKIYETNINSIKLEIAQIKLYQTGLHRVSILENLIKYLEELLNTQNYFMNMVKRADINPKEAELTLKLNLLHEFGIIEFLRENIWNKYTIKKPMEFLISTLINGTPSTIQPRLSKKEDPKLKTPAGRRKLEEYLRDFGLKLDQIEIL